MATLIRAARLADGLSTSTKPSQAVLVDAGRHQPHVVEIKSPAQIAEETPYRDYSNVVLLQNLFL